MPLGPFSKKFLSIPSVSLPIFLASALDEETYDEVRGLVNAGNIRQAGENIWREISVDLKKKQRFFNACKKESVKGLFTDSNIGPGSIPPQPVAPTPTRLAQPTYNTPPYYVSQYNTYEEYTRMASSQPVGITVYPKREYVPTVSTRNTGYKLIGKGDFIEAILELGHDKKLIESLLENAISRDTRNSINGYYHVGDYITLSSNLWDHFNFRTDAQPRFFEWCKTNGVIDKFTKK